MGASAVLVAGLPLLTSLPATGQTASGQTATEVPPRLALDLSAGLRSASNPDLQVSGRGSTRATFGFGLNYAALTQDQAFRLGLTGSVDAGSDAGSATGSGRDGLDDPTLTLSYNRQGANSAFSLDLTRADLAVDFSEPQLQADGTLSYSDLAATSGRVITTQAGLALQMGQEGPLGLDLTARAQERDYSQTNDPSVQDDRNHSLGLTFHLRGLAGGDMRLALGTQDRAEDDALDTRSQSRSLTLTWGRALDSATLFEASLGATRAERRELGQTAARSEGLTGAFGLRRSLANGEASLVLDLSRDARGPRPSLRLGRALKLASGDFSAELGVSAREGATVTGRLSWAQDLKADKLSLSLSRQVVAEADADTVQTSLQANWRHVFSEGRSLGLSYGLSAIEAAGTGTGGTGTVDAITRHNLRASFTQDLTRDWALTAGVELRRSDRDSTGLAEDQAVFVTVARRFVLLP